MTDVHHFIDDDGDGGNIEVVAGQVTLSDGLVPFVTLSLFGGNERDPGGGDERFEWWGNKLEEDESKKYRSRTQHLLRSLPLVPSNLRRIEDAVLSDLASLVEVDVATKIAVVATIPALNTVRIEASVQVNDERHDFVFTRSAS